MGFRSFGLAQAPTGSTANRSEFFINSKRTAEPHASLYCLTPREAIKVQHLNYHYFYFILSKDADVLIFGHTLRDIRQQTKQKDLLKLDVGLNN